VTIDTSLYLIVFRAKNKDTDNTNVGENVGKIKFLYMSDDSIVIQSWKETLGT
jgi:hypothetical protein